jgi:hypothetical protein
MWLSWWATGRRARAGLGHACFRPAAHACCWFSSCYIARDRPHSLLRVCRRSDDIPWGGTTSRLRRVRLCLKRRSASRIPETQRVSLSRFGLRLSRVFQRRLSRAARFRRPPARPSPPGRLRWHRQGQLSHSHSHSRAKLKTACWPTQRASACGRPGGSISAISPIC